MKKLAIIGCGGIGSYHLEHFLEYTDIELAGFCDLIPERAQAFAEKAGRGQAFTDYREMYDAVNPDMVFICIPPTCHGEIEFETIRRGIPFFVEKPLALDLDLARRIRDAAEEKGIITASGFQCRYSNIVKPTMDFLRTHEVPYVECARMGGIPGTPWWIKKDGVQLLHRTFPPQKRQPDSTKQRRNCKGEKGKKRDAAIRVQKSQQLLAKHNHAVGNEIPKQEEERFQRKPFVDFPGGIHQKQRGNNQHSHAAPLKEGHGFVKKEDAADGRDEQPRCPKHGAQHHCAALQRKCAAEHPARQAES